MIPLHYIHADGNLSGEECFLLYLFHENITCKKGVTKVDPETYQRLFFFESLIQEYNRLRGHPKVQAYFRNWFEQYKASYEEFMAHYIDRFPSKPVHWGDRVKSAYFNQKLEQGHQFEVYIDQLFKNHGVDLGFFHAKDEQYRKGESAKGVEVKFDNLWEKYGNLYIEYQEKVSKSSNTWVNSGIMKEDNTIFYLIGTRRKFWILRKQGLLALFESWKRDSGRRNQFKVKDTSKGFVMSTALADTMTVPLAQTIDEIRKGP